MRVAVGEADLVDVSADGRTLYVVHRAGGYDQTSVEVAELPERITVTVRYESPADDDTPTPGPMWVATVPVPLVAPLGERPVHDARSGNRLAVWPRADIRVPTLLPPGTAVSDAPRDEWTVDAVGDGYHVVIRQDLARAPERPAAVTVDGDESTVVGAARVRGLPARVERHLNRSWQPGDPEHRWIVLDWVEAGYRFRVMVSRLVQPYDQNALTRQAVRIATGLVAP